MALDVAAQVVTTVLGRQRRAVSVANGHFETQTVANRDYVSEKVH